MATASLYVVEELQASRPARPKAKSTLGDIVVEDWKYEAPPRTSKEAELTAILDAPLEPGETSSLGFVRKERELIVVLATLTIHEAHYLRGRLANPHPDDVLATKFSRLTLERRTRIIGFVADTRRRHAVAASGR